MLLYIPFEQGISKLFSYFFFTFFFFVFLPHLHDHTTYILDNTYTCTATFREPSQMQAEVKSKRERRAEQASKFHQTPILYDHPSSLENAIPASSGIKSSIL